MNIENMISGLDFDKFQSDCLIHDFLRAYMNKKSNLSLWNDNEADILRMQIEDFSNTLEHILTNTMCFPSGCEDCVGMQKCAGCIHQDSLADAFVKLRKYL